MLIHLWGAFYFQTLIFDAAGELVGEAQDGFELTYCGGDAGVLHYGDTGGDCLLVASSGEGCRELDAGAVVCIATDAGSGG